ncbi:MAG: ribosome recycling factor [Mycoplasma sp.]
MDWKNYETMFLTNSEHVYTWLDSEFSKLRTGRVSPTVLESLKVDAYGDMTPLRDVANISTPEPRVLIVKPYDSSLIKKIEESINANNLGVNPQVDGDKIRISFPPLTEEIRKDQVKKAKTIAEDAKVKIRKIRQLVQDNFKKDDVSDDDKKYFTTCLDKVTKEQNEKIENMLKNKSQDIMTI